ncbi:MAG: hypothetical protein LBP79_02515 [Clostridiales bacterium]|jgi:acetyl-CoA carboxylase carboxyltransferase component|nr:hypothetical protein [Clostridiales bacterium]
MDKIKILDQNTDRILRASAKIRAFLDALTDPKSLVETDVFLAGKSFTDGADALGEGVVTGSAIINGVPVYLFAQNSEVLSGSLGAAQADKIVKNIYAAEKAGVPFISVIDSAGARIGEGISASEGFSKIIKAAGEISGRVPHIAVVKGNCVGLMSVYLSMADFVFADENAKISVTPPTVLAAVSKTNADALKVKNAVPKTGGIAYIYKSETELREKLGELLALLPSDDSYIAKDDYADDLNRESPELNSSPLSDPYALLAAAADDGVYLELYGGCVPEVKTALGRIAGITVAFIAFEGGKFLSLAGIKKLSNFIFTISDFNIPLVSFVDCKGVEPSLSDELNGLRDGAASLMAAVGLSSNKKIAVITGGAIGYVYGALASKAAGIDYTFATVNAVISPINPETAAVLIGGEDLKKAADPIAKRGELIKKYAEEAANPFVAAKDGYVDNIIEPSLIRPYVAGVLTMLVR